MFYTNYQSRKGREIEANPFASLVFFWQPMERQVRVEGKVVQVSEAESDEYFRERPTGSKLGAWVSNQSGVVAGRAALEAEWEAIRLRFPRPTRFLDRRTGEGIGSCPTRSSSGKGGGVVCMTGSSIARPPKAAGESSDSLLESDARRQSRERLGYENEESRRQGLSYPTGIKSFRKRNLCEIERNPKMKPTTVQDKFPDEANPPR